MLEANHILGAAYNCSCLIGLLGGIACSYIRKLVARSHEMNRWPSRVKKDISRQGLKEISLLGPVIARIYPRGLFSLGNARRSVSFPPKSSKNVICRIMSR